MVTLSSCFQGSKRDGADTPTPSSSWRIRMPHHPLISCQCQQPAQLTDVPDPRSNWPTAAPPVNRKREQTCSSLQSKEITARKIPMKPTALPLHRLRVRSRQNNSQQAANARAHATCCKPTSHAAALYKAEREQARRTTDLSPPSSHGSHTPIRRAAHPHASPSPPCQHLSAPWTGRRSCRCRRSSATRSPRWPCSCSSRGWSTSSSAAPPTSSPRTAAGSGPSASAPCAP